MDEQGRPEKRTKRMSLRWWLIMIIFAGWVLPILLTLAVSGYVSYANSREHVADLVTVSVKNNMETVQRSLNLAVHEALNISYDPTIRTAFSDYIRGGFKSRLYSEVLRGLQRQFSQSQMVAAAYMLFPESEDANSALYYTYNAAYTNNEQAVSFYKSEARRQAEALLHVLDTGIDFIYLEDKLYMVRLLSLQANRFQPYAVIVVQINTDALFSSLNNLPWLTDVSIRLNSLDLVLEGQAIRPEGITVQSGDIARVAMDGNMLMLHGVMNGERYTMDYCVNADLSPVMSEGNHSIMLVVFVALLSVPLMALVLAFFMRRVNRPISRLSRLAGRIEQGEFGAQTDAEELGSAEFYYLGTQMNAMSARLDEQFERLYREELALRDAKMKALQSQINPHFLGNTLEIINWEARLAGNVKVSRMMEALSTMLEATLDRRRRPMVHLSEEMMYVDAYLYILKERLGKRLTVEKSIDPTLMDWYVPRLILQPLVENAIEHGVTARQHGVITIRGSQTGDGWMTLEVVNDTPMSARDEEKVHRLLEMEDEQPGEGSVNIGIRNVHQRLRLIYGPRGGLSVKNDKNGNTVSSICIQYREISQFETT